MMTQRVAKRVIQRWVAHIVIGLLFVWRAGAADISFTNGAAPGAEKNLAELKRLSIEELMAVEVATVTTVSKHAERATDAPATVMVITATDIKLRGYSTLVDVLRDLPGMETIPYFFSEFGTQVPVRGIAGNNKIIVLVNGMRVNPPGGESFPFRSDFSVRDAERIEVIYGPGSTLYGQDAISAVINIITKPASESFHGELGAAGGMNAEREAWGTFGKVFDKARNFALTGSIQYHDSDLTQLDKKWPAWWAEYAALAGPRGSGVIPERHDFGLNVFSRLDYQNSSIQLWFRDSSRSSSESGYPPAYVPQAIWHDSSIVIEGRTSVPVSDKVRLDGAITYSRYEIDPETRYVFNVPNDATHWFLNDYKYGVGEGLTFEGTAHWALSEKLTLLTGFEAGLFDIIPKSTVPGGANPDGDVIAQGGNFTYSDATGTHMIPRVVRTTYETYAGYFEFDWAVLARLKLIAGTRVTGDSRFSDIPVTPRVAAIYTVTEQWTVKYIYTRAYVAPAPYFANATYDNGTLLATSNPNLSPETAETHELNLEFNKKNMSLGLSGYYGSEDHILTVSDRALPQNIIEVVTLPDGTTRTLVQTANGGNSQRFGADVYGRATIGPVSAWASYSYVDFTEKNAGVTTGLPSISRHNGRVGLTWAITPQLFITPSLAIRSTPENVPPGVLAREVQTPFDVNLHILWEASKQVSVFATLRNLTDNRNALGGLGAQGRAIPQETFNGVMGVKFNF